MRHVQVNGMFDFHKQRSIMSLYLNLSQGGNMFLVLIDKIDEQEFGIANNGLCLTWAICIVYKQC